MSILLAFRPFSAIYSFHFILCFVKPLQLSFLENNMQPSCPFPLFFSCELVPLKGTYPFRFCSVLVFMLFTMSSPGTLFHLHDASFPGAVSFCTLGPFFRTLQPLKGGRADAYFSLAIHLLLLRHFWGGPLLLSVSHFNSSFSFILSMNPFRTASFPLPPFLSIICFFLLICCYLFQLDFDIVALLLWAIFFFSFSSLISCYFFDFNLHSITFYFLFLPLFILRFAFYLFSIFPVHSFMLFVASLSSFLSLCIPLHLVSFLLKVYSLQILVTLFYPFEDPFFLFIFIQSSYM